MQTGSAGMEGYPDKDDGFADHAKDLIETSLRLVFINATQKGINLGASVVNTILIYTLGIFMLFFLSAALAWWIGDLMNSRIAGFLLVGGLYFLGLCFVLLFKKKIFFPSIRNVLIRKIYE